MKIGIIGLPKSGKTTIFNALTGSSHPTDKYVQVAEPANIGVVQILDERISTLSKLYNPRKTIYAHIEYHDFPGIFATSKENPENALYNEIKAMEGFVLVLRSFFDPELDELYGKTDPISRLKHFETEMIISDLILAEKRLEKIELGYKRGVRTPAVQNEERILRMLAEQLESNIPISALQLSSEDQKTIRGFQFFSQKPLLVLLNTSEDTYQEQMQLQSTLEQQGYLCERIAGKFEEELSTLEADEAGMFMEDMGISESAREKLNHLCYKLMGYISFFTVGEDEVRAWTIEKGDNAVTAAGKIHSDLARGFIRAECFKYDDLLRLGSEIALREKGLFKLEGKEYLVQDGDIISIRFSV
ncbi:MAG: DUF933 domain-containing protein [Candidatus Cloacimonetes bacterium]|nr:DUF933 domain-containing protein [Candidatus Cloacimonadota bacterium]